jgi:hypothetical protein
VGCAPLTHPTGLDYHASKGGIVAETLVHEKELSASGF